MERLIKWATDTIDHGPAIPIPFLVALLIVAAMVYPTIRKAWTTRVEPPAVQPIETFPIVQMNAGGIYTLLVNIEMQLTLLAVAVKAMSEQIAELDRTAHRRQRRQGKTRTDA